MTNLNQQSDRGDLSNVRFVKRVSVGSIDPNNPLGEEQQEAQMRLLNKCLNEFPHGVIIGRNISVGVYQLGEHKITLQQMTYHVGFPRKPAWMDEENK